MKEAIVNGRKEGILTYFRTGSQEKEMKCPKCGSHKLNMKGYGWLYSYESKCWECHEHINRFSSDTARKKCGEAIGERQ